MAFIALVGDARLICPCRNQLFEHLLRGEPRRGKARLWIWASIDGAVFYLSDKYKPYDTPLWRIILGMVPPPLLL